MTPDRITFGRGDVEVGFTGGEVTIEINSWDGWEMASFDKDEARKLRDWLTQAIEHMEGK